MNHQNKPLTSNQNQTTLGKLFLYFEKSFNDISLAAFTSKCLNKRSSLGLFWTYQGCPEPCCGWKSRDQEWTCWLETQDIFQSCKQNKFKKKLLQKLSRYWTAVCPQFDKLTLCFSRWTERFHCWMPPSSPSGSCWHASPTSDLLDNLRTLPPEPIVTQTPVRRN